jgi:hypothetical protein
MEQQEKNISKMIVPSPIEKKILAAIELKKKLKQYEEEIKSSLLEIMDKNEIKSIKTMDYSITLATRRNYSPIDEIPEDYQKTVINTSKIDTYVKLYNEIPPGIQVSETKYITWKAKNNDKQ